MLAATTIGDGVTRTCRAVGMFGRGVGQVIGTFSSGFYIGAAGSMFAVGGPKIAAGPIHLVFTAPPPRPSDQSIVWLGPDRLWTNACAIDLSRAANHRPIQPSPMQLRTIAQTLARLDRQETVPSDVAHVWAAVRAAVERSELHGARKLLEGLGGGLTPTGDDVLAGLVLFAHWADPLSVKPAEVALHAVTTDLSRCFLAWAAVGQSIQPIHDLLDAACQVASSTDLASVSAADDRFGLTVKAIASIGHSSGKGLLAGLGLAAGTWPFSQ